MKTLLSLVLLLTLPLVADAQLRPGNPRSKSIRTVEGTDFAYLASAVDTAKDNANYLAAITSDLGGRPIIYGINILSALDTVTAVLALEHSIDSTTWTVVDSVSVTSYTAGQTIKTVDLSAYRDPYWRLRYGLGGAGDDFRSSGSATNGAGDSLYFFILTNFQERF